MTEEWSRLADFFSDPTMMEPGGWHRSTLLAAEDGWPGAMRRRPDKTIESEHIE